MAAPAAPASPRPSASAAHDLKTLGDLLRRAVPAQGPRTARRDALASRRLRELATRFAVPGRLSTLLLTGARVELPPELEAATVRFELPVPAPEEYRRAIVAVAEQLATKGRVQVSLAPAAFDELAGAASGLTLNQARQAVAHAALEDGRLDCDDLAAVVELKARRLAEDGLLELFPPADNPSELGGFGRLKAWLERARVGYGTEARAIGLEPPRGLLLVGVQAVASRSGPSRRASRRREATPTRGSPVACSALS